MSGKYDVACNCSNCCSCYFKDRRVVTQTMEYIKGEIALNEDGLIVEGGICLVTYETGEVQRLKRSWMDLWPQSCG